MKASSFWILAAGLCACLNAWAQTTAAGLWKTIDDETGKPRALVRIVESNGEYRGKIEKLFRGPGQDPNPKCDKCEGANKDQPRIGMTIITGMHQEGNEYTGGQILDAESGKVYKSKMTLLEDGKKLNVRGYIGMPMFGRTQTWLREE
jgi:uncharacterized protein (DUF2147 family)